MGVAIDENTLERLSRRSFTLEFIDHGVPSLERIEFAHELVGSPRYLVRGKTSGVFGAVGTFQWTSAVQALVVLVLRTSCAHATGAPLEKAVVVGERGSLAASLDYCVDKGPLWLKDLFGLDSRGGLIAKRALRRTNPGGRRAGPVRLSLNSDFLPARCMRILVNGIPVKDATALCDFTMRMEKSLGSVDLGQSPSVGPDLSNVPTGTPCTPEAIPLGVSSKSREFRVSFSRTGRTYVSQRTMNNERVVVTSYQDPLLLRSQNRVSLKISHACPLALSSVREECHCDLKLRVTEQLLRNFDGLHIQFIPDSGSESCSLIPSNSSRSCATELSESESNCISTILSELGVQRVALVTNNIQKLGVLKQRSFDVAHQPLHIPITPRNFDHIYRTPSLRYILDGGLQNQSGLVFIDDGSRVNPPIQQVWVMHAHDVLWEDNLIYEVLLTKILDLLSLNMPSLDRAQIRLYIDERSKENIQYLGFGPPSFKLSVQQTLDYCEAISEPCEESKAEILSILDSYFRNPHVRLRAASPQFLQKLQNYGYYRVMVCNGEHEFEIHKIFRSGLAKFFNLIVIHSGNLDALHQRIFDHIGVAAPHVSVVSGYLGSGIIPAHQAGVSRLFQVHNSNRWEALSNASPQGVILKSVRDLSEIQLETA